MKPKTGKDMDFYVESDFAVNYDQNKALNRVTPLSMHGYIPMYVG